MLSVAYAYRSDASDSNIAMKMDGINPHTLLLYNQRFPPLFTFSYQSLQQQTSTVLTVSESYNDDLRD